MVVAVAVLSLFDISWIRASAFWRLLELHMIGEEEMVRS